MAASVKLVKRTKYLGQNVVIADVTLDNSYPTGGYAISKQALGLASNPLKVEPSLTGGYISGWDYTNNKLKVWEQAAAAGPFQEVPNATDLHLITIRCTFVGE